MIQFKAGAQIKGLQPEILVGLLAVQEVFRKYNYDLVVTEGTGGTHMEGSFHYKGLAVDIRSKHIVVPEIKSRILIECKVLLGVLFDMIIEGPTTENEHFHLECPQ